MLPLHILSKCNVRSSSGIFQWINISARLCSSSSSSSSSSSDSSDSSDSDSDTEKANPKETHVKSASSATSDSKYDLESFLNTMIQAKKMQKTVDVAMQPKKPKKKPAKDMPFEKKIIKAAEDVADTFGGDKTKTTSDLLEKVLASRVEALRQEQTSIKMQNVKFKQLSKHNVQKSSDDEHPERKSIIQTLIDEYKMQPVKVPVKDSTSSDDKHSERKSIIQTLVDEYKMQSVKVPVKDSTSSDDKHSERKSTIQILVDEYKKEPVKVPVEDSITRKLLKSANRRLQDSDEEKSRTRFNDVALWNGKPSYVFENISAASPNIPELKTWTALEQRELKALTTYSPANIFQELILWTEQGKLWKFPIDNEQGMEEEQNVHFSEHVFMERHLKGWCPTSGPIRHFMELVCVGLSKNPYLTVQEKISHIMWYKEYFESKRDLLQELGAIQKPLSDKVKEITE